MKMMLYVAARTLKQKLSDMWQDESGMGVVEVVLIILVLVGLALVFKTQITAVASRIYDSINSQIDSFG